MNADNTQQSDERSYQISPLTVSICAISNIHCNLMGNSPLLSRCVIYEAGYKSYCQLNLTNVSIITVFQMLLTGRFPNCAEYFKILFFSSFFPPHSCTAHLDIIKVFIFTKGCTIYLLLTPHSVPYTYYQGLDIIRSHISEQSMDTYLNRLF